jgi:hypothetical protein
VTNKSLRKFGIVICFGFRYRVDGASARDLYADVSFPYTTFKLHVCIVLER